MIGTSLAVALALCGLAFRSDLPFPAQHQLWALGDGRVRVVFPSKDAVDTAKARVLIEITKRQAPFPGLPPDILSGRRITISLAAQATPGLDARSFPDRGLIIFPLAQAFHWEPEKLRRVIRHDLVHLGVGVFLNYAPTPAWFDEGIAEWAAGGLTCEGETRIRVELALRRHRGRPPPVVVGADALGRSRLSYDLLATFLEFIDLRWNGIVKDGSLLKAVRSWGFDAGLARVLGQGLEVIHEAWQSDLLRRLGKPSEGLACESKGVN